MLKCSINVNLESVQLILLKLIFFDFHVIEMGDNRIRILLAVEDKYVGIETYGQQKWERN